MLFPTRSGCSQRLDVVLVVRRKRRRQAIGIRNCLSVLAVQFWAMLRSQTVRQSVGEKGLLV